MCYGERDFLTGKTVIGSIAEAIYSSHKTIAVMSPDFIKSRWCVDYELIMCYTRILNKEGPTDSLIVMKYRQCHLPKILARKIYLDKEDNYFWEKLLKSLGPPKVGKNAEAATTLKCLDQETTATEAN